MWPIDKAKPGNLYVWHASPEFCHSTGFSVLYIQYVAYMMILIKKKQTNQYIWISDKKKKNV